MRTRAAAALAAILILTLAVACDDEPIATTDAADTAPADTAPGDTAGADGDTAPTDAGPDVPDPALAACIAEHFLPAWSEPEPDARCAGNVGCSALPVVCGECACTVCFGEGCLVETCDDGGPGCEIEPDVSQAVGGGAATAPGQGASASRA